MLFPLLPAPLNLCHLGSIQPPAQWVLGLPPLGIKWPEHEAGHSPSSNIEVCKASALSYGPMEC